MPTLLSNHFKYSRIELMRREIILNIFLFVLLISFKKKNQDKWHVYVLSSGW